jgi:acetylornithine deacetylase
LIGYIYELATKMRIESHCSGFEPPYTTMNVGIVRGGEASNIVAAECRFRWDVRPVPGHDGDSVVSRLHEFADRHVLPGMREIAQDASVTTEVFASAPSLSPDGDSVAKELAQRVGNLSDGGMASFTTEAGLFQQAQMSAVVCGPGSIEQAHKPDEFIETSQLDACSRFLRGLGKSLAH